MHQYNDIFWHTVTIRCKRLYITHKKIGKYALKVEITR